MFKKKKNIMFKKKKVDNAWLMMRSKGNQDFVSKERSPADECSRWSCVLFLIVWHPWKGSSEHSCSLFSYLFPICFSGTLGYYLLAICSGWFLLYTCTALHSNYTNCTVWCILWVDRLHRIRSNLVTLRSGFGERAGPESSYCPGPLTRLHFFRKKVDLGLCNIVILFSKRLCNIVMHTFILINKY